MNIMVRKTIARSYERKLLAVALLLFTSVFHGTVCYAQNDDDDDIVLTDSTSTDWGGGGGGGLNPQEPDEPVTSLKLSYDAVTLEGGETVRLVATVNQRAKNKSIKWISANDDIAFVDFDGTVTGLHIGVTTITAISVDKPAITAICTVTVTSDYVPPTSGYVIPWGRTEGWTVKYQVVPYSMDPGDISWTQPCYDDSSWPVLTGPIGNDGERNYQWEGDHTGFNLRYEFNLPVVDQNSVFTFYAIHDDDLWIYLNGELVGNFSGWSNWQERSVVIPTEKFVKGKNQLALRIMQGDGGQYLDFALFQKARRNATGAVLPDVPFEFYYNAIDYNDQDLYIPNQDKANLKGASLNLSANLPEKVGDLLRITGRCEGFIDKWGKGSTESGAYFYRQGQDCMTIVAKVAPRLNTGNASDFVSNRGGGHNYMWRIGDNNSSFLHTGTAYQDSRSLVLTSDQPQVLAVRVDGANDYILLQNLTTGESKRVDGVNWGGGNNVFKFFYNDGGEYYLGDFYWIYYSFELLTDKQLAMFSENQPLVGDVNGDGVVNIADAAAVLNVMAGKSTRDGDVNGDGVVNIADVAAVLNIMAGK